MGLLPDRITMIDRFLDSIDNSFLMQTLAIVEIIVLGVLIALLIVWIKVPDAKFYLNPPVPASEAKSLVPERHGDGFEN